MIHIFLNLLDKKFDIINKFLSANFFNRWKKNYYFRNFHLFNYTERL